MEEKDVALTTIDNKWNPFTNFDEWFAEDSLKGTLSCCYKLAKEAKTSNDLPDSFNDEEIRRAIDKIVSEDKTNTYVKVYAP